MAVDLDKLQQAIELVDKIGMLQTRMLITTEEAKSSIARLKVEIGDILFPPEAEPAKEEPAAAEKTEKKKEEKKKV